MKKAQLYTWIGSENIESYSVESCAFHRVLAYYGVEYESHPGTLSKNEKFNDLYLTSFPFFIVGETRISNVHELIKYAESVGDLKTNLWPSVDSTHAIVVMGWSKSIASTLVSHLRFVNPANFKKLVDNSKLKNNEEYITAMITELQSVVTEGLKILAPELGGVETVRQRVREFSVTLQELLRGKSFVNGSFLSITDIYLAASVQLLLDPIFSEHDEFISYFEPSLDWLSRVNQQTSNEYTITPSYVQRKAS